MVLVIQDESLDKQVIADSLSLAGPDTAIAMSGTSTGAIGHFGNMMSTKKSPVGSLATAQTWAGFGQASSGLDCLNSVHKAGDLSSSSIPCKINLFPYSKEVGETSDSVQSWSGIIESPIREQVNTCPIPEHPPANKGPADIQGEISTFVRHVQQCQEGFNLRSLYHVLLLVLPRSPSGQVESWQHLQRLTHSQPGSVASSYVASSCVDWLASYLQHLSTLKERFDTRVVVLLYENLYMHEEPAACPTRRSPLVSIPHLAAQLCAHQRNWGLLLQGGNLSERAFSPQSLHDLRGFADVGPFVKVLRLVPDVFHQSLVTADLAQRWVCLHHSRYSLSLPPSPPPAWGRAGLAPGTVQPPLRGRAPLQPGSPLSLNNLTVPLQLSGSSAGELRAQLWESREELLALLHRGEQAAALRTRVRRVAQRIRLPRLQQRGEGAGLAWPWQSPGMGVGRRRPQAALAEELQKSLELEEYHHSILEADWLLELEVRPILLRRIDVARGMCLLCLRSLVCTPG
ncbi:hypothetical protein BTVI_68008 [Pitangus sulphuratus]|nr:hypothetical protein BTVI_68008 [Pitangus sulphuratus]